MKNFTVDARLESLIPPLSSDQYDQLEANLKETGGPIEPLWLWGDVLVDGHHRYKICRTHGLMFETKQVWDDIDDFEEVKLRMKALAIGQRNLNSIQQSKLRAEVAYELSSSRSVRSAVAEVAQKSGVSERQVWRDRKKAKAASEMHEDLRDADAVWKASPETMSKLALLHPDEQISLAERAGFETKQIAEEVKRLETTKGSTLYDAKKAERKRKAEAAASRTRKKGLVVESVEQLAQTAKVMRETHRALQLAKGNWDRAYHHLTELDQILAAWKEQA